MDEYQKRNRAARRLERQFESIERSLPALRRPLHGLRAPGWWMVRLPVGILLTLGGLLSILPLLSFWMLPVGLLLIAVDLPIVRGPVSAAIIKGRRKWTTWRRRKH